MRTISSLRLDGFLSFPPGSEAFDLAPLNVLIGPNGAGKSNFLEAIELLGATPGNFASAIRDGGRAGEWIWKGEGNASATLEAVIEDAKPTGRPLRYRLAFTGDARGRLEVVDEAVEEVRPQSGEQDVYFYYRYQEGRPALNVRNEDSPRHLARETLVPDQSVLAQRKDPDQYPEVTWLGERFAQIRTYRDWTIGRYPTVRRPQRTDLPEDILLADNSNLALVLNQIEHHDSRRFRALLRRFFPRFEHITTPVSGGQVEFFLHERGFSTPIPSTRLSDGTIRFIAMLALLLAPRCPPLICLEEPELGLHPDALTIVTELLVEASERTQLIITTHSDALVSALSSQPEAVVACERPGAGTTLRRLDGEQLGDWLDQYQLGDLWRMGELGANS